MTLDLCVMFRLLQAVLGGLKDDGPEEHLQRLLDFMISKSTVPVLHLANYKSLLDSHERVSNGAKRSTFLFSKKHCQKLNSLNIVSSRYLSVNLPDVIQKSRKNVTVMVALCMKLDCT